MSPDELALALQREPPGALDPALAFGELPAEVSHVVVPTRHGGLDAAVYAPAAGPGGGVYVNLHGGGFVLRHPEQDDALCRYLAARAGVTVVNVDYVPAPQSRFPGPVEQAYDVAAWAAARRSPWDGTRLAIGGQSAGGSLAAGAARLALEEGGVEIRLQVLMYPPLDLTVAAADKAGAGKETLLVPLGPVFDAAYCPDPALRADRLLSPAARGDDAPLAGIAPALVVTAERDILREEAVRYADRLRAAGALAGHVDVPGAGHGFNLAGAPRETVESVYARIAAEIRAALG